MLNPESLQFCVTEANPAGSQFPVGHLWILETKSWRQGQPQPNACELPGSVSSGLEGVHSLAHVGCFTHTGTVLVSFHISRQGIRELFPR